MGPITHLIGSHIVFSGKPPITDYNLWRVDLVILRAALFGCIVDAGESLYLWQQF